MPGVTDPGCTVVYNPFFLPGQSGKLFALHMKPSVSASPPHGVLFFPPFAEEMNKSRRMVSLQARRMVASGYQVDPIARRHQNQYSQQQAPVGPAPNQ